MKPLRRLLFGCLVPLLLPAADPGLFSPDMPATRESFRKLCDFIAAEKKDVPTIFIAGYYMRDLVAGYRIFGEKRYLDVAIQYADDLLKKQGENGYWSTGYGAIYLADTGSAIGLFIVLQDHVDATRRRQYSQALDRYMAAIKRDELILPCGALGVGMHRITKDGPLVLWKDQYTISSALTGAEVFMYMYHQTKKAEYQTAAYRALQWILSTMRSDGLIPYVLAGEGADWAKRGDPKNDYRLYDWLPYLTSAYVGEGVIFFDKYSDRPDWKKEIRAGLGPHIEYLLRTQSANGIWKRDKYNSEADRLFDLTRSPGIVNFLTWYYRDVRQDPRIVEAVRKFNRYLLVPEDAKALGMLTAGAAPGPRVGAADAATSLAGRALADIIQPGIDAQ